MAAGQNPSDSADRLVIRGRFIDQTGNPIAGAAVHECFLGDPPSNCGTCFDLEKAVAHTDGSGEFLITLSDLDHACSPYGPPGVWRSGCFLVLAVRDSRTIGYVIASGDELDASPVSLAALPPVDIQGRVADQNDRPVAGGRVNVELFRLFVGRGPYPSAPVNFWLSRPGQGPESWPRKVTELTAVTDAVGYFLIRGAPALAKLDLTVEHPDYATLETSYFPYQPTMRLVMQPASSVRIRLQLPDGRPAAGFAFVLEGKPEGSGGYPHRDGVTDEAGVCELGGLPAGSYVVRYYGGAAGPLAVPAISLPGLCAG